MPQRKMGSCVRARNSHGRAPDIWSEQADRAVSTEYCDSHFLLKCFNLASSLQPPRQKEDTWEVDLFRNGSLEHILSVLSGNQQLGAPGQQQQLDPLTNTSQTCQQSSSVVSG